MYMKHLKRFNEELNRETYLNAAKKLKDLGHNNRASNIQNWSKEKSNREYFNKWETLCEKYSKYGGINIGFKNGDISYLGCQKYYLCLKIDDENIIQNIETSKSKNSSDFEFQIALLGGLIPADKTTADTILEHVHNMYGSGVFNGLYICVNYKVENDRLSFSGLSITGTNKSIGTPYLEDRSSSFNFKKILKSCFNENSDYPNFNKKSSIHDDLFRILCQQLELTVDYNFTMERVVNDIQSYSTNLLYKN